MSSFDELDDTVAFLKEKNCDYSILQCTTSYPTQPENFGLNVIQEIKSRYNVTVGFSDHSGSTEACIAAAALGAEIFEFHAVFNKSMFGPDVRSSLIIDEISSLTIALKNIEKALNNAVDKNDISKFESLKNIFEKSLAVNKDLPEGHIITFNDLEAKKPADKGIKASRFKEVIGKKVARKMMQWDFLNENDII
jgi:N-acetylneuraminate synthase